MRKKQELSYANERSSTESWGQKVPILGIYELAMARMMPEGKKVENFIS